MNLSKAIPMNVSRGLVFAGLFIIFFFCIPAYARYSGGTGDPNDPYRIATPEDLNDIGNYEEDWDKHFTLVNDVNLAEYTGTQFKIIGNSTTMFTGVFDGNDHKVWNFTWSSTRRNGIGLFGCVGAGGRIKNLGMENVDVNAATGWSVASLVGCNEGKITNCYSTGNVAGQYDVGGLIGTSHYGGTVTNCHSNSCVSGSYVGGLMGFNIGEIINCYSTGSVSGADYAGGLVGVNDAGEIANCYSTGSVSGRYETGGLVGGNTRMITNCYSSGSVTGRDYVGGLVGRSNGALTNCYSTGNVGGDRRVGGLVGDNSRGRITNCYSTGSVTGKLSVGGLVGVSDEYAQTINSFWDTQTSGQFISDGGIG